MDMRMPKILGRRKGMASKAIPLGLKLLFFAITMLSFVVYIFRNKFDSSRFATTSENFLKKLQRFNISTTGTKTFPDDYRPKILVWAKQYHTVNWKMLDLPNGEKGCDLTFDRSEFPQSDAVVFFMKSCSSGDLPRASLRSQFQAYVWWSQESPWTVRNYYHHDLKDFANFFNWTMTYRTDSDILGFFMPVSAMDYVFNELNRTKDISQQNRLAIKTVMTDTQFKSELDRLMLKKKKFISWVVSDCDITAGASKRKTLVKDLKEKGLLEIDEFGQCVGKSIPLNYTVLFETLAPYKFYLAFENAIHCKEYITEKTFYNSLTAGVVPIIFGPCRRDVEKFLAPGSFIHIDDFSNYTELRLYLNYLDSNDTAYREYFNWWKIPGAHLYPRYGFNYGSDPTKGIKYTKDGTRLWTYAVQDGDNEFERFGLYHLCRKLNNMDHLKTKKTISNLHTLWYDVEPDECIGQ